MESELKKMLEIRTDSGELIFRLRLSIKDDPVPGQQKEEKETNRGNGGNGNGNGESKGDNQGGTYEPMTDAQKRYLFRLLSEQGFQKEAAHEELKKALRVDNLKEATKMEASREIERRLTLQKGGNGNDRT